MAFPLRSFPPPSAHGPLLRACLVGLQHRLPQLLGMLSTHLNEDASVGSVIDCGHRLVTLWRAREPLGVQQHPELRRLLADLQEVVAPRVSEIEGGNRAQAVATWYAQAEPGERRDMWLLMSEQFVADAQKVKQAQAQFAAAVGTPDEAAAEVPAWAVGTFSGFDSLANANVSLTILPGGADWIIARPDGSTTLDVHIVLQTDDGATIGMTLPDGLLNTPLMMASSAARASVWPSRSRSCRPWAGASRCSPTAAPAHQVVPMF